MKGGDLFAGLVTDPLLEGDLSVFGELGRISALAEEAGIEGLTGGSSGGGGGGTVVIVSEQ